MVLTPDMYVIPVSCLSILIVSPLHFRHSLPVACDTSVIVTILSLVFDCVLFQKV